jgi:hypothetical protein
MSPSGKAACCEAFDEPLLRDGILPTNSIRFRKTAMLECQIKSISFEPLSHGDSAPVTSAQQEQFRIDFSVELDQLRAWASEHRWSLLPVSEFHVTVSDRFMISRALYPAWRGHRGRMEFPAWRVSARKAAISHELVHVFFPNGNRLLAEGLAIYIQSKIGGNPAFPNFGRPLHELVRERIRIMIPEFSGGSMIGLDRVHLGELDEIATPNPLVLNVGSDVYGEEPHGQANLYSIAGSFIEFLIESCGMEKFRAIYVKTPLIPMHQHCGLPARWLDIFGISLAELELRWKRDIVAAVPTNHGSVFP